MAPSKSLRILKGHYPTDKAATYHLISHSQYKAFQVAHYVAPLSFFGSLAIIYRILKFDRHEPDAINRRTYLRLLVAMSTCDVLGSVAFAFATTPIPKDTGLDLAQGNTATCTAQGFFLHVFAVPVLHYNAGLMVYFLLTIRYNWSDSATSKWLEPVVHVWAIVIPFGQAVAGLFLDIFNPVGFGNFCHIAPYPMLCGLFDACTRGQSAYYLYIAFMVIPGAIFVIIIYVCIILIYCTVRGQARRAMVNTANRDSIRARTRSVAVQSWLFAFVFIVTWIQTMMGPLLAYLINSGARLVTMHYILSVTTSALLPLQGFFNFFVYIRPRFMRLWKDEELSFCMALKVAIFGGRETTLSRRRLQRRKYSIESVRQIPVPAAQPEISEFTFDMVNSDPGQAPQTSCPGLTATGDGTIIQGGTEAAEGEQLSDDHVIAVTPVDNDRADPNGEKGGELDDRRPLALTLNVGA